MWTDFIFNLNPPAIASDAGANADAPDPLRASLLFAARIIPVFLCGRNLRDGGHFPTGALTEPGLQDGDMGAKKAGMLPRITLAAGAVVMLAANWLFPLPG